MSFTFAQLFLAALCFYFVVHSVTCLAEIYHLKHTINEVPAPLKEKISLAQHRKAAKYDIARTKLNWCEVSVTTLLIVALTAGNGINAISDQLMDTVGDQFAFHWMLPAVVALIFVLVERAWEFAITQHLEMLSFFQRTFRFKGILFTSSPSLIDLAQSKNVLSIRGIK